MKNNIGLVCCLAFILTLSGCYATKNKFNRAQTINDYEAFIKEHPDGEYTQRAKDKITQLKQEEIRRVKEKQLWKEQLSVQIDNLKNYEIGITTIEDFKKDNWNANDLFFEKIGIINLIK